MNDAGMWKGGYQRGDLSIEQNGDRLWIYLLDQGELLDDGDDDGLRADASVELTPEDRHALAALCLHGQTFGFKPADAEQLRVIARHCAVTRPLYAWATALDEIAARIEALLPPPT